MAHRAPGSLLATLLVLALLLTACGGQTAQAPTAAPTDAPAAQPTAAPSTLAPTAEATAAPTAAPTAEASAAPAPTAIPAQASLGDPYYPLAGNRGYDVQSYLIELTAAPDPKVLAGTTTIEALATDALASFNLDFLGYEVSAVTVDGAAATFTRSGQELTVTPASPIAAGAPFTVAVSYAGEAQPYADPALLLLQATTGWKEWSPGFFASIGEPDGAMTWFPSNNHPTDKATFTFRITVDDPNVVAASGVQREVIPVDEDTKTYVWEMARPVTTALTMVAVGPFERRERTAPNGVPIRDYFPVGTDQAMIDRFAVTGDVLVFLEQLLGEYPFEEYGSLLMPGFIGGALETQTLSIFSPDSVEKEGGQIITHELWHHWYGNTLAIADWSHLWLAEGTAKYSEALWLEKSEGVEAYNAFIQEAYQTQLGVAQAYGQIPGLPQLQAGEVFPPADPGVFLLFLPTYNGGALVLHNLRMEVGDEAFFSILRTFYEEHKEQPATTEDFIATAERIAERDLSTLWETWLYGKSIPADFPALQAAYPYP